MPQTFIRSTELNNIISPDRPIYEDFFLDKLAFSEGSFIGTEEILDLYNDYLKKTLWPRPDIRSTKK